MIETSYPDSNTWYQPFLPFEMYPYETAADIVVRHFDFSLLQELGQAYWQASRELAHLKSRVALLTEKYGWVLPSGVAVMCPLMLAAMLAALPDEEPVPERKAAGGAPSIAFESLLRAFLLAPFYEIEDNSAAIWRGLANNRTYLVRCRFKNNKLPSERKFQQFNEVMNWAGLWGQARKIVVGDNYASGVLEPPRRLAIDPGHEDGYAGVNKPCAACRSCKACPKKERVPTCDVTGLVVKRQSYKFPGVKGVFIADVEADMPIMTVPVHGSAYEGHTGKVAAEALAAEHPEMVDGVEEASLDGIFDIEAEKAAISEALGGAKILTPINPRNRKAKPVEGHRGIDNIDPYGIPHCVQGLPMNYKGRDLQREDFIWGCPLFNDKTGTVDCPSQGCCCPNPGQSGRTFRVPRERTPQVDFDLPQHSAEFKERYKGRTAAERVIGRTKRSFPFERHWGRGRASFKGHLDKGVLAFHVLMNAAARVGRKEDGRSPLTFHKRQDEEAA